MRKNVLSGLMLCASMTAWANPVLEAIPEGSAQWSPIRDLGEDLNLGRPWHYKNLTIFPLTTDVGTPDWRFLTIDRALDQGVLEVKEKGDGEVNAVRVRNTGSSYIFGLAGDMIVGAKQDRMLQADVLIPPRSGWIELSVYCTEHGRWSGKTDRFQGYNRIAPNMLRSKAAQTGSQQEVWDGVAEAKRALRDEAPTSALQSLYNNKEVEGRSQAYLDELLPMPDKSPTGVGALVAVGSRIICVDVFANHALFSRMWEKLLRSYVIDALAQSAHGTLNPEDAEDFVRHLSLARIDAASTPGSGRRYRVHTVDATGSGLVHLKRVVHLDLFPSTVKPMLDDDEYEGPTPNLDLRRQGGRQ